MTSVSDLAGCQYGRITRSRCKVKVNERVKVDVAVDVKGGVKVYVAVDVKGGVKVYVDVNGRVNA
jgi:hypothetical protein